MTEPIHLQGILAPHWAGLRLDQALAQLFPQFSRSCLQGWVRGGQVTVDGRTVAPRQRVRGGEQVEIRAAATPRPDSAGAQDIPLRIVYEDADLLVIDKPAGLVTHTAAGHWDGTLENALLHHAPELTQLPRAGIVHRLDKDTTGLLVVARNLPAHKGLIEAMQARVIQREYLAVVNAVLPAGGRVDAPIGRHPVHRKRMAVVSRGRPAVTHYRVRERFRAHTYLDVRLESGRTHQIRVHMAHIRAPLVGDPLYGGRLRLPAGCTPDLAAALGSLGRQALHAARLALDHPLTGAAMSWESPPPEDLVQLCAALRADTQAGGER